jgi:hypothetical protein
MRIAFWLGAVAMVAVLAGELTAQQRAATPPSSPTPKPAVAASAPAKPTSATTAAAGDIRYIASVRDIMHVLVEANADKIFDSVAIDVTAAGIREKRPETDEEWDDLEHAALALAEAVNLIKMPDRPMAKKGEMNVDPEGPGLPPAEIAARVKRTRGQWNRYANELQDAAVHTLGLIQRKDVKGLFEFGGALDMACENCHLEYWYPDDKKNRK